MLLAGACLLVALGYVLWLQAVLKTWRSLPLWETPPDFEPTTRVSVVVAARNEAERIEACVRSILDCDYPAELREVIVADDYSEDETAERVAAWAAAYPDEVRLLRLSETQPPAPPGKKSALTQGIACARGALIATTDADCLVPPHWLKLLASAYERVRPTAIVAPVVLEVQPNGWERFQALDAAATTAIAAAALARRWFAMGSGANLCYPKAAFERIGGFAGNEHRASGDDMFLLAKFPMEEVFFLKNAQAAVQTRPCPTLSAFFQQRLRWGTKNIGWRNQALKAALGLLWALPFAVVLCTLLAFWHLPLGGIALLLLGAKAWADWRLLREMSAFFHQSQNLRHFWPALVVHVLYLVVVGLTAVVVRRYSWKGRRCR